MRTGMLIGSEERGWRFDGEPVEAPQLVLWFSAYGRAESPTIYDSLRARFPGALIAGCTTNGEIFRGDVSEGGAVAAALRFDSSSVEGAMITVEHQDDPQTAGRELAKRLKREGLRGVIVFADAFGIAGSELIRGVGEALEPGIPVSGGMAGDDGRLGACTKVGLNCPLTAKSAVAVGFYGEAIRIEHGLGEGWRPLGPLRRITRAEGPLVVELDGEPALDVYERLVGNADSTARLRHPIRVSAEGADGDAVIWEVIGADLERRALRFIDAVPPGGWAQILRGDDAELVAGAADAVEAALGATSDFNGLALVISCIGRKWVMGQRVGDETEAVQTRAATPTIGFYAYGELAPRAGRGGALLHHASITVTLLDEVA